MEREQEKEELLLPPRSTLSQGKNVPINVKGIQDQEPPDSWSAPALLFSTMITLCGSFTVGRATGCSSPAQSGIMEDLGMSAAALSTIFHPLILLAVFSVFGSVVTIGGVVGSLVNGTMADLIGRRYTMWVSDFFIIGWLAIAFAQGAWLLDLGRLLMGNGIGITLHVVPLYIAEITPKNIRGTFSSANQFMTSCGLSLICFIGTVVSWLSLALIGAISCALQAIGVFFVPETPRWESIEEGQVSRPLLPPQTRGGDDGSSGDGGEGQSGGSSATTVVVVLSTLVAVSGSYVFGSAVGYSSPTEPGIMNDLALSVAEYSLFGSILTIGAMIGAVMSGRIADYIGRRGIMGFSEIFCIVGWTAIASAKTSWWLDVGRLLVGYGMGLLSYVVPVFIAEITPKNLRGGFTTVHQLMICCGVSITYLIGAFVSWRILALIGTIPCIVQLLGIFFIPESPRWLAKIGRWEDCEVALQRLRGENADISDEASEIRDYTETIQRHSEASMFELFQWKYAHSLIVGVGLMVLQQFGGVNGIAFYASSIFVSAGFSGTVGTIAMVVVQIPMTALGVALMDISGRRLLLMISSAGTCLGCLLVALSFLLQDLHKWMVFSPFLALFGVLIYTGSFSLGMGGIPWVIMSEVFPINMKGSAGSLVTLVSWLGSWIISYAFNFLMNWSSAGTFFMFSSICGLTVLFVAKLVPETKGRTLEEIQASMNPFSGK